MAKMDSTDIREAQLTTDPPAPEEEPKESDLVTQQALNERLELFERGLKSRLEPIIKEAAEKAADRVIREFKRELESEHLKQQSAESSKRLDRSVQWSIRFVSGVIGAAAMLLIVVATSQCSELHERIRTLEFNQPKTK